MHICQFKLCIRIFFRRSLPFHHLTWAFHTRLLPPSSQGTAGTVSGLARWPLLQNWEYLDDSFSFNSVFISAFSTTTVSEWLYPSLIAVFNYFGTTETLASLQSLSVCNNKSQAYFCLHLLSKDCKEFHKKSCAWSNAHESVNLKKAILKKELLGICLWWI